MRYQPHGGRDSTSAASFSTRSLRCRRRHARANASGQGGIRTHGTREGPPVFKTGAFNRSATCPNESRTHTVIARTLRKSHLAPHRATDSDV